ncbi:MAG: hypothetical protein AAED33_11675 [Paracoccaceae bacterium]|jgi:uncharacterized membrane protein YhfC
MNLLGLIGGIVGIIVGWTRATKRGGNTADKLQYAAGHGIALLLVGHFIALFMAKFGI